MLSVVIPTLNAEASLAPLLKQVSGHTDRIIIADGGSTDATLTIASQYNARFANGSAGRGGQLARGASWAAQTDWYLFLHADCALPDNWQTDVKSHISGFPNSAAYFRFGTNAKGLRARAMEFWVGLRCFWLKWPYGDQGLLISRRMYESIGGYPDQILFEDVEIIKAIKRQYRRKALRPLNGFIRTDISRYYRDGFWKRGSRNLGLLRAYLRGGAVESLARRYK